MDSISAMWLINTATLERIEIKEHDKIPPYAVLSHTWCQDDDKDPYTEVRNLPSAKQGRGFGKVRNACARALQAHKLEWLWADSLCIDRTSDVELSNSINSISSLLRNCAVCLTYLEDIYLSSSWEELLPTCRWVQRSWTLMELIAPRHIFFYDHNWCPLGSKTSLNTKLSQITGVDCAVLDDPDRLVDYSVGRKMSWAAKRSAYRSEDVAYSLLGLFGVRLTVRYGEGKRAFTRLQEEIMKTTCDGSLLAWTSKDTQHYRGLLARSPAEFDHFALWQDVSPFGLPFEFEFCSTGLFIRATFGREDTGELVLGICETTRAYHGEYQPGILLRLWDGAYVRAHPQQLQAWTDLGGNVTQNIRARREIDATTSALIELAVSPTHSHSPEPIIATGTNSHARLDASWEHITQVNSKSFDKLRHDKYSASDDLKQAWSIIGAPDSGNESIPRARVDQAIGQDFGSRDADLEQNGLMNQESEDYGSSSLSSACSSPAASNHETYESYLFESASSDTPTITEELDGRFADIRKDLVTAAFNQFCRQIASNSLFTKRSGESVPAESSKRIRLEDAVVHCNTDKHIDLDSYGSVFIETPWSRCHILACPFYMINPVNHFDCMARTDLRTIKQLKQHLWTVHIQRQYCPICGSTFDLSSDRENHIRQSECETQDFTVPEGMTEMQLRQLAKRAKPGTSETSQWLSIWHIVTSADGPNTALEKSPVPYLTSEQELIVSALRDFWLLQGQVVMAVFLEGVGLRGYNVENEERNLNTLYQLVLNDMIDQLLLAILPIDRMDGWRASGDEGSVVRDALQQLREFWYRAR